MRAPRADLLLRGVRGDDDERFHERIVRHAAGQERVIEVLPLEDGAVEADRGQMNQVLMNLCLNARDAMPEGGRLSIEAVNLPRCEPAPHPQLAPGDCVRLRVRTPRRPEWVAVKAARARRPQSSPPTTRPSGSS